MDLAERLARFIESSSSDFMPDAASELLELLEADAVEPLGGASRSIPAEELADRLEQRVERLKKRGDDGIDGLDLLEDAVAHLRAQETTPIVPQTFEDSEGVRWFVLSNEDEIVACYTSRPFIEADI